MDSDLFAVCFQVFPAGQKISLKLIKAGGQFTERTTTMFSLVADKMDVAYGYYYRLLLSAINKVGAIRTQP